MHMHVSGMAPWEWTCMSNSGPLRLESVSIAIVALAYRFP